MYLNNCWQVAAFSREIVAGRMLSRRLLKEPVVLWRTSKGRVVAMQDRCPHRSAPLSKGKLLGDSLRCGYHGLRYDTTGKCIFIPGQTLIPPKARVRMFPVVERYTFAWIWMGDEERADPDLIPDVHWMDRPGWIASEGYHAISANYKLLNDNLLDLSHETYVHVHTIGHDSVAETPVEVKYTDKLVCVTKEIASCNPPPLYQYLARVPANANVQRWQRTTYQPPGYCVIDVGVQPLEAIEGSNRVEGRVINLVTPETDSTSHYFWAFARNFRLDEPEVTEFLRENVRRTFDEDREMLEAQQTVLGDGDFDPAYKVAVKADAGAMQGRRLLATMIESEQRGAAQRAASKPADAPEVVPAG
jgi:phenylpropionate dioxygenase-like ring-hydroxylating dioxygenase large terminal subunit